MLIGVPIEDLERRKRQIDAQLLRLDIEISGLNWLIEHAPTADQLAGTPFDDLMQKLICVPKLEVVELERTERNKA